MNENEQIEKIGNTDSLELLKQLKEQAFESSDVHLALAMGRPVEEIEAWFSGAEQIDEDAEMKIHGIAKERLSV
ncbi:MAG: hypothetical protein LC768_02955 [Acidobacteria bacterium]|nr:hypothetical protein [Acidobacteriota bacterium]MCA1637291.1 hypothetical protein [Acidobacteriota bacterium]